MDTESLMGDPFSVRIKEKIMDTENICTLNFQFPDDSKSIRPGQFLMVWIPGVDEIPMSISYWEPPILGINVQPIGPATNALVTLEKGDWIGVRGPFGSHFDLDSRDALVIGGGIGMAPLRFLTNSLLKQGTHVVLLIAARTKDDLLLYDYSSSDQLEVKFATDDGSLGFKGFATDAAKEIIPEHSFDMIYACGPELMMAGLFNILQDKDIPFQFSLERYMKCGCGICGTCAMDPDGVLVCIEGPVFTKSEISRLSEFGMYSRDSTGVKKKCGH
ncbi:MAG: putative dihydroorotate dehydrogenase B (NAD(+)), electron transfer subunit [Candidatus Thorarchaeota archaeon]|nr:MAG: putative dihydroorotate dehydrogenase B (NAD(+)), electron transfer subunit [Candidatus Thorarchaeota archaeon]